MNDLRFAVRQLAKRPGFTATAVVTLALGIGATTTIFSVVDHLMLRELPFEGADRIVTVWQNNARESNPRDDVAPGNYLEWKDRNQTFEGMGAAEPYSMDLLVQGARPEVVLTSLVTEGFFEALGVRPYRGRLFGPDDYREAAGPLVVLSYTLWQQRFGGDPGIIGSALHLDRVPRVVVGILPPDFDLGLMESIPYGDLWAPRIPQGWERTSRSSSWWTVVGRLKAGVSVARAQADMDRVAANLAVEFPATNEGIGAVVLPLREHLVGAARPTLLLLLGAVGVVLLIACANVANLQLARGTERLAEFGIRTALGAGRRRIIRQLVIESAALSLLGATAGVVLAFWGVDVVKSLSPGEIPRLTAVTVDLRVLSFALALGLGTALAFGLAPMLQLTRKDVHHVLREQKGTAGRARRRMRDGLVVAETALACTLLVGGGLLFRSFAAILSVDPGFDRQDVLALQIFHYVDDESGAERAEFFRSTLTDIRALPGVRSAGAVLAAPFLMADIDIRSPFRIAGEPAPRAGEEPHTYLSQATPGYFETLGIPVLRGRGIAEHDRTDAPAVAVINETLRRRHWPTTDPIGRTLLVGSSDVPVEIVGVVGDVRHTGLDVDPRPELFLAHTQGVVGVSGSMTYFVRTNRTAGNVLGAVQDVIWEASPLETFYQTGTVKQLIAGTLAGRRFTLILLTTFAAIALLMAAVGIYGVMSFTVSQRTRELGIRMALGADRRAVLGLIVRHGLTLAALGVAAGLTIALLGSQVMTSLLFGVAPRDPASFGLAVTVLVGAALLASYLPARRATRVAPMEALRHE